MEQNEAPVFGIEKLYVKDLSLEVPNAPAIFLEPASPAINVELGTQAAVVAEGFIEVTLTVTVTAKMEEGDKVVFLVEAAQAGIFQIRNIPHEDLEPIMMIGCANILFPYAREAVSDAVARAGFQPVVLAPVNFEAMYAQNRQQAAQAGTDVPIQ